MAYLQFGNTWWGEKWLDALLNTDYSNRLPRGKSYARNGSVKSVDIKDGQVMAKVKGSRPAPYQICLSLPQFSENQKASLLNVITGNPFFLSSLLNHKMPPALLEALKKNNLSLFPKKWSDIKASCSCPDWADCCKHIAAIIYMIANEIDKNPFTLFDLRAVDLFKELEKLGFKGGAGATSSIPLLEEWILKKKSAPFKPTPLDVSPLDFSLIPSLGDELLSLLPSRPLFSLKTDFKDVLAKGYKHFRDQARFQGFLWQMEKEKEAENTHDVFTGMSIECKTADFSLKNLNLASSGSFMNASDHKEFMNILKVLFLIPSNQLHTHCLPVAFVSLLVHFCLQLMEKSAFLPEIHGASTGHVIRYMPALIHPQIRDLFNRLCSMSPPDMITGMPMSPQNQVKMIVSSILGVLITEFSDDHKLLGDDEIGRAFFRQALLAPSAKFEDQGMVEQIALWLGRFHISHKQAVPVIKINEEPAELFSLEVLVEEKKTEPQPPIPLKKVLKHQKYEPLRMGILKDMTLLGEYVPELEACLISGGEEKHLIDQALFGEMILRQLPVLRLLGIPLLLPKGLDALVRPRISASVKKVKGAVSGKSYVTLTDMLDFDWRIALGDQLLTVQEFLKLAKSRRGIVKLRDQFVYLDEKEMEKLMRQMEKQISLSQYEKLSAVLSGEYEGTGLHFDAGIRKLMDELLEAKPTPLPASLKATLRPYQQRGYEWLVKNGQLGFGSLIADDMGLGKTVQVIAKLLYLKEEGRLKNQPALVVVPTTLLTNWLREMTKFAPGLQAAPFHGHQRQLKIKDQDIVLTTYGLIRRDSEKFAKLNWSAVILDEAQNIKNPATAQTKAIKKLKSPVRIAMTGTPVENRLSEYWSLFDFLNKGYLKSLESFKKEFASPIELNRDQKKLERFRRITMPFLLRRLKTDTSIIQDLPKKMEINQMCQLSKEQAALYQNIMEQTMKQIEEAEGIARRGLVLKLITSLKQICNHPSHYLKKKAMDPILSGKTDLLTELLKTIYDNEEKVLIFTQYTQMGELLQRLTKEHFGRESLFLHGGVMRKKRDKMVEDFQNEPYLSTLILSLKAGGTGLNLTAAQNVIHFDLWWNPAVEAQATDRAYRIGQKNNVMVHRLITKGTFEEKIDKMIQDKKELASLAVSEGEKWIGECSDKELRELFELQN